VKGGRGGDTGKCYPSLGKLQTPKLKEVQEMTIIGGKIRENPPTTAQGKKRSFQLLRM